MKLRKYIPMYLSCGPNMDKFIEIITSKDERLLRQLSVYIHKKVSIKRK